MSSTQASRAGSNETRELDPFLSPESQKDLDDALDETPSAADVRKAWVEENVRDIYRAFAVGRTTNPILHDGRVEIFSAVEGTEKDLRYILVVILIKRDIRRARGSDA